MKKFHARLKQTVSQVMAVFLLSPIGGLVYHVYDLAYYVVANTLPYYAAMTIMALVLFVLSISIVRLHQWYRRQHGIDLLGLAHLSALREAVVLPGWAWHRRMTRFILRKGFWALYLIGPCIIGPFMVALILGEHEAFRRNVFRFIIPGTIISIVFWFVVMRLLGLLTWEPIVAPTVQYLRELFV